MGGVVSEEGFRRRDADGGGRDDRAPRKLMIGDILPAEFADEGLLAQRLV